MQHPTLAHLITGTEESGMEFHPTSFNDYLGQDELKQKLAIYCQAARERSEPLDHLLLFGPPGVGKTTLAQIMAHVMGVDIKICNGPMIERTGDMVALLSSLEPRTILFIDEIHRLPSAVEEVLYNAMEHFRIDVIIGQGPGAKSVNLPISPFTLVGATTKSGMLSAPLQTRFGITERLDFYNIADLSAIVQQNARFLGVHVSPAGAELIARCGRGTPRVVKKILRRVRDYAQVNGNLSPDDTAVQQSLAKLGLDPEGLSTLDHRIINTLLDHDGGPLGLETLAHIVGEDAQTIEQVYEPYLMRTGYLERTPRGRAIPAKMYTNLMRKRHGQMGLED